MTVCLAIAFLSYVRILVDTNFGAAVLAQGKLAEKEAKAVERVLLIAKSMPNKDRSPRALLNHPGLGDLVHRGVIRPSNRLGGAVIIKHFDAKTLRLSVESLDFRGCEHFMVRDWDLVAATFDRKNHLRALPQDSMTEQVPKDLKQPFSSCINTPGWFDYVVEITADIPDFKQASSP